MQLLWHPVCRFLVPSASWNSGVSLAHVSQQKAQHTTCAVASLGTFQPLET